MRPAVKAILHRIATIAASSGSKWVALIGTIGLLFIADTYGAVSTFF